MSAPPAPSVRSELLPLIGRRASVEIAALVIPAVVIGSAPAGPSATASWIWGLLYALASLAVVAARRRFNRDHDALPAPDFERRWARPLELSALGFGLLWGLLPWTAAFADSFPFALFVYLVVVGTTASTVAFAAADLRVFAHFLVSSWLLATLAVPWAFPNDWMTVLPLAALFPWLVWRHARTQHGFLLQQSRLKRQSLELAQAHEEARDAAARASREKSLFLATASHDLRQPLYALTLTAQAAVQRNRDAALAPLLVDISQAASHVNELLNSLLDVSALDSRGADLALQPLALSPLLSELHERFLPEARSRGLQWRIRAPDAPAWVVAEPMLLRRALSNLLHNALRYTPAGGVLLAVRHRADGWAVEVWDTGIGMAASRRERLFGEFHRGDDAEAMTRDGQGLGLSVVRDCVRRMRGRVEWHSTPGRGSCFRIVLSRASTAPAPLRRINVEPSLPALRGRVLVVDDDLGVTRGLGHLLADWRVDARCVHDAAGADATLADGFQPDVVMCDLRLGGGASGYELLLALLRRLPDARGVIVTGELDRAGSPDLASAEAEGYLVLRKPVKPAALHGVLRALLTR